MFRALITLAGLLSANLALAEACPPVQPACTLVGSDLILEVSPGVARRLRSATGQDPIYDYATGLHRVAAPVLVATGAGREIPVPTPPNGLRVDCDTGSITVGMTEADVPLTGQGLEVIDAHDPFEAFEQVGLDLPAAEFSMGWARGSEMTNAMGPKDPCAWYLYLDAELEQPQITIGDVSAAVGPSLHATWWLDPRDPAIYTGVRGSVIGDATAGYVSGLGYGFSNSGNLHWTPAVQLRGPDGLFDPGLTGHVTVESKISVQPMPGSPIALTVDADWLLDLGDAFSFTHAARLARRFLRAGASNPPETISLDSLGIRPAYGANARSVAIDIKVLSINLLAASLYVDGSSIYFRGVPTDTLGALAQGSPSSFWGQLDLIYESLSADLPPIEVTDGITANALLDEARQLVKMMQIRPSDTYGYVVRREGGAVEWAVGMTADVVFGGCQVEDAQVRFSDRGIEVTHGEYGCDFVEWSRTALAAACAAAEEGLEACVADAEERCELEACDEATTACYDRCIDNGRRDGVCRVFCGVWACELGTELCTAATEVCEGLMTYCGVDEGEEGACAPGGVAGFEVIDSGDVGCGSWAQDGDTLQARGGADGTLLLRRFPQPEDLQGGHVEAHLVGTPGGAAGFVMGYQGAERYYLALVDDARDRVQLWLRQPSGDTLLGEHRMAIDLAAGHDVKVRRAPTAVHVEIDGVRRVDVRDTTYAWGRYGLYSRDNDAMDFEGFGFVGGCGTNMFTNFDMINLGEQGCGGWYRDRLGRMVVRGNVRTDGQRPKQGSMLLRRDVDAGDGVVETWVRGSDDDVAGLVVNYRSNRRYYVALLDQSRGVVQLWVRRDAGFERIAQANMAIDYSGEHHFAVRRNGDDLEVMVDGVRRLRAHAAYVTSGRYGLYAYDLANTAFTRPMFRAESGFEF